MIISAGIPTCAGVLNRFPCRRNRFGRSAAAEAIFQKPHLWCRASTFSCPSCPSFLSGWCTSSCCTPPPALPSTRTGTLTSATTWRWCSIGLCQRIFHSGILARGRTIWSVQFFFFSPPPPPLFRTDDGEDKREPFLLWNLIALARVARFGLFEAKEQTCPF